jgi:hypothetical protein
MSARATPDSTSVRWRLDILTTVSRYKYRVARIIGRISDIINTLAPVPYSEIMEVHWALLERGSKRGED